jgi:hypothetical protein
MPHIPFFCYGTVALEVIKVFVGILAVFFYKKVKFRK